MVNASFTADAILDDITGTDRTHFFLLDALLQASGQNGRCSSVLQAYYKFTQTSGDLLVDSLSAISDADSTSISNMDQSNSGIIGNGYRSATGGGAEIVIGGTANDWNFLGRSDWTANFWINSDEAGGFNTKIFSTTTLGTKEGIEITYNSNNAPQLKMGVTIFDNDAVVFSGSADTGYLIKNDQTWHMYTIVIREGIGMEFYRDAVLHTSTVNTNTFGIGNTNMTPVFFGEGTEDNPDTNYDEFSFFDGALTSTEISQLYNSGSGLALTQPFLDGLIGNQQGCVEIDAVLKSFGANGSCPAGGEAVSTVLDNIDLFDTQVNVSPNLTKTGQRWTPTVGEVALLQKGISRVNLWHGHTGGSGQFRTFVWQNATAGTSSETIIRDGGTFFFFGSSSGLAKRLRILFDAGGVSPQIWLPTAGVEYVIGVEDDFPGTAQTRKTGTDTINGVFTQRTSAGVWTDTVGQDWALQFTIEQSGLGQGGQNLCLGVDGRLRLIQLQQFTVDAILVAPVAVNTQNFTIDGLLAIMPSRMFCVDAVLQAFGITEIFEVDGLLDIPGVDIKDFTVDALIQSLGENGQCPIPATETFYSRAKSVALAERLGEGVNSPFAGIERSGVKILGSTHAGKAIEDIRALGLSRNNVGATGTILATVRSQNDTVIATSTNMISAESLPLSTSSSDITFTFDKKVVLQDGYKILIEFPNCVGCADSSNTPNVFWFGTSTASPAGTSRVAFGKSDTVNPGAYITETTTGFTQGGTISFTTSAAEPAEQRGCAEVDALLKATQTEDFTVDAQLLQLIVVQTKDFTVDAVLVNRFDEDFTVDGRIIFIIDKNFIVDAKLNRQVQFIVDVSITPDTGVFRDVADLIVRVLFEDQDLGGSGLTGRQVVDAFVAITRVELQWGFTGKNSRIRSYLNTMKFQGIVQEDGSDPDWYETIWTLVNIPP